jgi:hypothetical protein
MLMVSLIHFILLFTRLSLMHSVVLHWIVHGTYKSTAGGNGSLVDDFFVVVGNCLQYSTAVS